VNVVADGVVVQDFVLGAGRLHVIPSSLNVNVPLGGAGISTFVVTNDGTASATYEIGERDLGFDILKPEGARATRKSGHYSPLSAMGGSGPKRTSDLERPIPAPNAPPWQDVAEYPTAIMDSTADVFEGLPGS